MFKMYVVSKTIQREWVGIFTNAGLQTCVQVTADHCESEASEWIGGVGEWSDVAFHRNSFATHTHTRLAALFPWLCGWASTRKVKPIWILLKQETVSGSGISWATCKSAPRSRQITTPAPHHSVFYRPDAFPATQSTASKHWRQFRAQKAFRAWQCESKNFTTCSEFKSAFSALTPLGVRKSIQPVKNWVMGCRCGCLSGARCRFFACGPADATAIPEPRHLLPHLNPDWFYLSGTGGLPILSWQTGH